MPDSSLKGRSGIDNILKPAGRVAEDGGVTARREGRRSSEDGFTLVELLVALLILAVVMVALAPAFYDLMKASSSSLQRSVADGMAVAAAEQIRSYPYWEVGYTSDNTPDYCTGSDPVVVTASPMDALTNETKTVSNVTYAIESCVYWATASDGRSAAYKSSVVKVLWGPNKQFSYTLASALYPGAEGLYTTGQQNFPPGQGDSSGGSGPVPTPVVNSASAVAGSDSEVQVDWQPVTYSSTVQYWIEYWPSADGSTRPAGGTDVQQVPVGNGTYDGSNGIFGTVTGLSPGSSYYFDVVAQSGTSWSGASAPSVSVTTNPTTSTSCQITGILASPQSPVLDHHGQPIGWSSIAVSVGQSNCHNLSVYYGINGSNGHPTAPLTQVLLSGSGATLTGSASQSTWSASTYGFVVYDNGTATTAQANVTPCTEQGSSGQC
ncbi:MAG: fibronectin type III domain-containing protein [Acidimicrobiales bacterium]